jgi:P27 family predicted phage terminase small subunit
MGLRGPKKQPAAVKVAKGTFRRDRDASLPMPAAGPIPPAWLSAESREVWAQVVEMLGRIPGLLAEIDAYALARYCDDWVEYWEAKRIVDTDGIVSLSEKGTEFQNPAVGVKNKAAERMTRFEARFGMTPSDRSGLGVSTSAPKGVRTRAQA